MAKLLIMAEQRDLFTMLTMLGATKETRFTRVIYKVDRSTITYGYLCILDNLRTFITTNDLSEFVEKELLISEFISLVKDIDLLIVTGKVTFSLAEEMLDSNLVDHIFLLMYVTEEKRELPFSNLELKDDSLKKQTFYSDWLDSQADYRSDLNDSIDVLEISHRIPLNEVMTIINANLGLLKGDHMYTEEDMLRLRESRSKQIPLPEVEGRKYWFLVNESEGDFMELEKKRVQKGLTSKVLFLDVQNTTALRTIWDEEENRDFVLISRCIEDLKPFCFVRQEEERLSNREIVRIGEEKGRLSNRNKHKSIYPSGKQYEMDDFCEYLIEYYGGQSDETSNSNR